MKQSYECANLEFDYQYNSVVAFTQSLEYTQTINLKSILGDMYYKYDNFIIYFNSIGVWGAISSYNAGSITGLNASTVWTLGIKGLSLFNNTNNGNLSSIGYFPDRFTLPLVGYLGYNSSIQSGLCFRKTEMINLSVAPYLIRGGGISQATNTGVGGYDINLSFTIYGLYDEK